MDDSSLDWDYLQMNSNREAQLNFSASSEHFPELGTLRDLDLYGTRKSTTSGLPDELSLEPRVTR